MFSLAIIGSRDYDDLHFVREFIEAFEPGDEIVTGNDRGVQSTAEESARAQTGVHVKVYALPKNPHGGQWEKEKFRELLEQRNESIANHCHAMLAFWDGRSPDVVHGAKHAISLGKPLFVVPSRKDCPNLSLENLLTIVDTMRSVAFEKVR